MAYPPPGPGYPPGGVSQSGNIAESPFLINFSP